MRGVSRERMSSSVVRMRSSLCVFDATRKVKEGEEEGKALCFLPASVLAPMIRAKRLSPVELMTATLNRIERL